jgi:mRNA-degrading endonuclease RelE of RelBE toxin-antitoxin system
MHFRISDTFTDSLARLRGDEQKAVKSTAFDLQLNPANPGMKFHKLDRARDQNFWSVRASRDLRLIVHRSSHSLLLCYVGHHDDAYRWAERRKLERHPKTGAAQLVEVRETVEDIRVPRYVDTPEPTPAPKQPLAHIDSDLLLSYGVPSEWAKDLLQADEDGVLELAAHLPAEAAEAVLALASGERPPVPQPVSPDADPFEHPDARRRFRSIEDSEELRQALEYPWEKWSIFLHPAQRDLVEQSFSGPARVAGSAGTGKTVVALHRAAYLARRYPEHRILLTTFSDALAGMLKTKLRRLAGHQPGVLERIEVHSMDATAARLHNSLFGPPKIATEHQTNEIIGVEFGRATNLRFPLSFVSAEWSNVIDAWQIRTWEQYQTFSRRGQKTRLTEGHRESLWAVFENVRAALQSKGLITEAELYSKLAVHYENTEHSPYDHIVIDEAQDLSVPQLRFLATVAQDAENGLFFAGDQGQRIFQSPFSWKSIGVDIRGRSRILKVNYRTSHQIRSQADRLLAPESCDIDGNIENRAGTVSVFNGPVPLLESFDSESSEIVAVSEWLKLQITTGIKPEEVAIFVRSSAELSRAIECAQGAAIPHRIIDETLKSERGHLTISTMHLAKGLEYRAVAIVAADDEVIPSQARIDNAADERELEDIYNTERHLLYVACTRARENLWISGVEPLSEFVDDLLT